jgi:hypothetical protein
LRFFLFISVPTEIEAKATLASLGSFAVGQPSDFSLYENRKLHLRIELAPIPLFAAGGKRGEVVPLVFDENFRTE